MELYKQLFPHKLSKINIKTNSKKRKMSGGKKKKAIKVEVAMKKFLRNHYAHIKETHEQEYGGPNCAK